MFNRNTRKRRLLAAEICASSLVATAAHAGYSFSFGEAGSLTKYADVRFANAVNAGIPDSNFAVIGQHGIADGGAPALGIESMSTHKAVLKGENDASI